MRGLYGVTVVVALLATVGSTLSVYPHQLAYFNELAGGPENGYRHLLHSNLDWEQNGLLYREWMEENGIHPDEVENHACDLSMWRSAGEGKERGRRLQWVFVSASELMKKDSSWRERLDDQSVRRVGYSLWVFPLESLSSRRAERREIVD